MSKIYIIQYSIPDDSIIKERIKLLGSWMNFFPKNWIIESELTAEDIYKKISVDYEKERILIMELSKTNYYGVMPKTAWDWIKDKKEK